MRVELEGRKARILDFDCECRPLAWYGGDWVTKQPTAIAWKFIGERYGLRVRSIGGSYDTRQTVDEERAMVLAFLEAYDSADIVTGHFIRGFDLPLVSGAMMRLGLGSLPDKLAQDTKLDLAKGTGLSKSQENLGAMFELRHPKVPMNTTKWAEANMLMPEGIAATEKRVIGDVRQHIELRQRLLDYGLLRAPRVWTASASGIGNYHA